MDPKPLVAFVGPSGVGKTSFANRLSRGHGFFHARVGHTRKPRDDDGKHYRFLSPCEFRALHTSGQFLEVDEYNGEQYGTYRSSVERLLESPRARGIILDITPGGYYQVRKTYPTLQLIKLIPDDPTWLIERLKIRGTREAEIKSRESLLESFLQEVSSVTGPTITVSFKPETWDIAFSKILETLEL